MKNTNFQLTACRVSSLLLGAALLLAGASSSNAASGTWTNSIANGNWSGVINWSGGIIADGADSTATFSSSATRTITLDSARTLGNLTLNTSSYNLIGGNPLTLQTSSGIPTVAVNAGTTLIGSPLSSSQQISFTGGGQVLLTNQANNLSGGIIYGSGNFGFVSNSIGSGTIVIGQTVGAGQIGFDALGSAATGTTPIVVPNNIEIRALRCIWEWQTMGGLNYQPVIITGNVLLNMGGSNVRDQYCNNNMPITFGGVVSGGGSYGINLVNGTLNLTNANNSFTGNINFTGSTLLGVTSDGALGFFNNKLNFNTANSQLRALASFTVGASRQLVMAANTIIDASNNVLQVDCPVTGAGTLTKNGVGTLNLTGANTFSAGITLNAGTFEVSGSGALATSSAWTVLTNTILQFQDSASVPNVASYTINSGGKFYLIGSPTIKATAPITVNAGGLLDVSGLGSTFTLNSGEILSGSGAVNGAVTAASGSTITGNLAITNGAVTASSGSALVAGTTSTAGTLTFGSDLNLNGQTIQFDLTNNVAEGGGTNDEIRVGGNLTLAGGEKIFLNYMTGSLAAGTYKLIKFSGTLTGTFALATAYPNVTIDNGVGTPGYVAIVVTGGSTANNLFWKGDGVGNLWDVSTTANWVTNFAFPSLTYNDPAKVTFDEFGSNNVPVTLNSTVYPNTVTFNVTNKAYTLTGPGKISGPVGVTINGGNAVTNGLANDYTGTTTINGASKLVLLDGSSVGSGAVQLNAAAGQVIARNSGVLTIANRVFGNAVNPTFIQSGSGTTVLANTVDNSGLIAQVNAGTLQLGTASSSGIHAIGGNSTVNTGGTLQLGGSGGDQIFNSVTVNMAGGTFDEGGLDEQFATLAGYGSVANTGTMTLGNGISLSTSGTLAVTNTSITISSSGQSSGGIGNPGSFIQEGGTLSMPANFWFGSGSAGLQKLYLDGTIAGAGGETIWGEVTVDSVTTFGPNANATFNYLSCSATHNVTNWYNGGTINLNRFNFRSAGAGTVEHHFNGTSFNARRSDTAFFTTGGWKFYVSTNGFILNDAGYNLTIFLPLLHDYALGANLDGGLNKSGTGTLTLSATNTFNGSLAVNGGSLLLNNAGAYNNVQFADNTSEQINFVQTGRSLTNGSLTLGTTGAGTQNLNINLGSLGIPSQPVIQVNNILTNSGNVVVSLIAPFLVPGTAPLVKYGSMDAANFATTWSIGAFPYVSLTLTNDIVNKLISVIIVPGVTPKWRGDLSSVWNINTTSNWRSNGLAVNYLEPSAPGQPVTFDDTAVNYLVDISTAQVNPLFVNMTNGNNYTISGTLGIGGTGALIKKGAGSLTLSNANNTYSGITAVDGGSVLCAQANVISPNSTMTLNNSALNLDVNNQAIGSITFNNTTLSGTGMLSGGSLSFNNGSSSFVLPPLAGALMLTQNGTGTISLTNANTYSGQTLVNAGTVRVTDGDALGVGGFSSGTWTLVSASAALMLDGNVSTPEHIHMLGAGPAGGGALVVTNGNSSFNQPIAIDADAVINIGTGSTLTNGNQFYSAGAVIKTGGGTLWSSGNSGQNGGYVVSNGTVLAVNVSGSVIVNSGGTYGGNGTISGGSLLNKSGGSLTPGFNNIGTITVGNLTNSGAIVMEVSFNGVSTNADRLNANTTLVYGGSLTVTNIGPNSLAAGMSFKLFNAPAYNNGSFASVTLPALSTGLGWTNRLGIDGTIAVVATVSPTPFSIGTAVSGGSLTLTWPSDHTGWRLQNQTNSLSTGLNSSGWFDVAGATGTNQVVVPISTANPSVFYRMVYP